MTFNWKALFGIAQEIPVVKEALRATVEELEHNPGFVAFVTKYQKMNPAAQCMICLTHKYARDRNLHSIPEPPRHQCADRRGAWYP